MSSQTCSGLQPLVNFPTHKTASDLRVEKIFSAASAGTVPQRCALLRGRAAPWGHTTRPAAPRSGQMAARALRSHAGGRGKAPRRSLISQMTTMVFPPLANAHCTNSLTHRLMSWSSRLTSPLLPSPLGPEQKRIQRQ